MKVPIYYCEQFLPSGAHLGGQGPPRWAPEGREVSQEVVVIDRFHCIETVFPGMDFYSYLHKGHSYTSKMTSLYWGGSLVVLGYVYT